ncbi:hypothetical protein V6N11_050717 [Hibiscus sabdariffa]|uniref:Uncharacterized protein n=1 Tax=Hibiscus sabdariffa TaxID=183260 RepID=A0ABR2TAM5_9ROSI
MDMVAFENQHCWNIGHDATNMKRAPGCAIEGPGGVLLLHLGAAGQGPPRCATEGPGGVLLLHLGARTGATTGGDGGSCWGCCCHHERNLGKHGYRRWIKRRASEAVVVHFYGLGYVFEPLYLEKEFQRENEKLKIQNRLGRCVYL